MLTQMSDCGALLESNRPSTTVKQSANDRRSSAAMQQVPSSHGLH